MTPNISLEHTPEQLAPASSLNELLILPIPAAPTPPRSLWRYFARDLSFLLPACGVALGWLLLRGQSPFAGATLFTVCALLLALRLHTAWLAWRERRRIARLRRWYQRYRSARAAERNRAPDEWPAVVYVAVPPARNDSRAP